VLRATRADDPLAYGIQRLRQARATHHADLNHILNTLPPDRRQALTEARSDLNENRANLRRADREVVSARAALEDASRRRWGRHDKPAIHHADQRLHAAPVHRRLSADAVTTAQQNVAREHHAVQTWTTRMDETADARAQLERAITDLDGALHRTRPERVAAATLDPLSEPWQALGPPPHTRGGLNAWCGIAEHLTAHNDTNPTRRDPTGRTDGDRELNLAFRLDLIAGPRWDQQTALVDHADRIITIASRLDPTPPPDPLADRDHWQTTVEIAMGAESVARRRPIEHDLGLGW
jgi:hypothetical protein